MEGVYILKPLYLLSLIPLKSVNSSHYKVKKSMLKCLKKNNKKIRITLKTYPFFSEHFLKIISKTMSQAYDFEKDTKNLIKDFYSSLAGSTLMCSFKTVQMVTLGSKP